MQMKPLMAVVDDDEIFHVISRKMVGICAPDWEVMAFRNGNQIMQFLHDQIKNPQRIPDIMLLDINMPQIDGWMFLDGFRKIKSLIKKPVRIYLTSSSIDPKDIKRANREEDVTDYLIKPLTVELINKIIYG